MSIETAAHQSLRSVHITNYYHENSGGISTSLNKLLDAAERQERHLSLIVPGKRDVVKDVGDFTRIYFVKAMQSPILDRRYRLMMPWQYMPTNSKIKKILLDERPDVIEVVDKYSLSMIGAMIRTGWFKHLKRPMLVHFSCERMDDNISAFFGGRRIAKWMSRNLISLYLLPSFDFHIANSEYTADEMRDSLFGRSVIGKWLGGVTANLLNASPQGNNIYVCPCGVDMENFPPGKVDGEFRSKFMAENGFPDDAKLLIYAGRISQEKNVGLLADVMIHLAASGRRDIKLAIAGAGPLEQKLQKQMSSNCPDGAAFLGHLSRERLSSVIANADVFIHPNPREPFGIGPLEAMASGIPVVAPAAGGILTYANSHNAWLMPPDGKSFTDAVIEALSNKVLRQARIAAGLETAAKFTSDRAAERQLAVYDQMHKIFVSAHGGADRSTSSILQRPHSATS